nr:uncharacterized protein LOC111413364 [Onthophagus taurus]
MKITLILLISIWCLKLKSTNANYRRGLRPQPPRNQMQQYPMNQKKWHMNHQNRPIQSIPSIQQSMQQSLQQSMQQTIQQSLQQQRGPRPIPLHIPQNSQKFKNKQPLGPPQSQIGRHPPPPPPIRSSWPNQMSQMKILTTDKPFLSSPAINLPEYDFHLQTNSIPNNHPNTIKQLDEKGPIHTIPAPNLSLADRPKHVDELKPFAQAYTAPHQNLQFNFNDQQNQAAHQVQKLYHHGKHHNDKHIQKSHQYQVTESTNQVFFNSDSNQQPHAEFLVSPQVQFSQQPQIVQEPTSQPNPTQMTTQEFYKLLNNFPSQQQPLEAYVPVQYVTNFPRNSPQNFKKQPQFQIFDLDDQRNQNQMSQMTKVTADYSVKPAYDDGEALAQAQFVQHFFDTRSEVISNNNKVEPELKQSLDVYFPKISTKLDVKGAESILNLQEAGKVVNNVNDKNVETTNSVPISIYVPDNERFDENEDNQKSGGNDQLEDKREFGENLQDDGVEHFQRHPSFGKRKKIRS